jgi:hypothetical protein
MAVEAERGAQQGDLGGGGDAGGIRVDSLLDRVAWLRCQSESRQWSAHIARNPVQQKDLSAQPIPTYLSSPISPIQER